MLLQKKAGVQCTKGTASQLSKSLLHSKPCQLAPVHRRSHLGLSDTYYKRSVCVFDAASGNPGAPSDDASQESQPAAAKPESPPVPKVFSSIFKSLQDFGIGKNSLLEGSLGLFLVAGIGAAVALLAWARGTALRTGTPYQITIEFPLACGITIGTPVRIRGVQVGQVLNVKPSLERVDVLCEVNDVGTVIPRNSVIEANQSGLIAEPLLDITPQLPIPAWKHGPGDAECDKEGAVVCSNGRISGQPGVALDDLVYIMTRLARQAEADGFDKMFAAAEAATQAMEEAKPLLQQSIKLVEEVTPLLAELRSGGLVDNLEELTSTAAAAAADIQKLQGAVLTDDNVRALRQSVLTLCRTLEHVESISSDVSLFTRDSAVQRNLRTLVQALSRLVEE
mmetsp:Transcript_26472/g.57755  ORF Transcript_26472/g.57755 Transcript_26472/m.57755 type:complete len:394 (+) Transcript_26472:321-1502(+)|eukprot:CAMPEP_0202902574 /NCGR_PEP_ID=MMETSP1392-20130828/16931_1 /ASSEMBLY_ACC=CAM_ASM_000868 /TAXON_ID=225041 /ORGANISM="Chlamydomonas chlamydogama, Strain SAG 11-48b" /LENGTH=393 /DNA_ID=CAMNT_0049589361 /DNA_START=282 /DNA_END=1463 /DNA_ORIENTATION=+